MPNRPNPQQEPESGCQETHHHHLEYLKNRMPTQQEMDDAAELFKVFATDPLKAAGSIAGAGDVCPGI